MTFSIGHVEGGTRAGWRTLREKPNDWECECPLRINRFYNNAVDISRVTEYRKRPGYLARCSKCGAERPRA